MDKKIFWQIAEWGTGIALAMFMLTIAATLLDADSTLAVTIGTALIIAMFAALVATFVSTGRKLWQRMEKTKSWKERKQKYWSERQ